ncbi:MAG: VWA domain-containing protein [Candidatus Zixiibacteriota bacterium]|jgi:hypothetical protein
MIAFLQPLYLLLLPLAALPIILNLIKRRVRLRVRFPSVELLKVVEERRARRRPRWQEILLLVVRVMIIACFVLALAGPRFDPGGAAPPRAVLLVIDNSPSMTYVDGGEPRLDRAVSYARDFARGASAEDVGAAVLTGAAPGEYEWTSLRDVGAALEKPPAAPGGLAETVAAASTLWARPEAAERRREVAVFTDMQAGAFEGLLAASGVVPKGVDVTFYDVREETGPAWNVALTGYRLTVAGAGYFDGAVDVRQYGRPRPTVVTAGEGGGRADVPASSRATARFAVPAGGRATFSCAGGYPFDDHATVDLPATTDVFYEVEAGTPGRRAWEAALGAVGATPGDAGAGPGVYVMPLPAWARDGTGRTQAERGGVVVLMPAGTAAGSLEAGGTPGEYEKGPGPVVADAGALPRTAEAGAFRVAGAVRWENPGDEWKSAATTADGRPVILHRRMGKGEVFAVGLLSGREYSDFFASAAFVAFALDLKTAAMANAYPAFTAARNFDSPESDPKTMKEAEVQTFFPGAVVTRRPPGGTGREGTPLRTPLVAAVFLLLAAEALLAAPGRRPL